MPKQSEIAEHLGLSERRVRDVLKELNLDASSSIDQIRDAYITDLREKAAGRGGVSYMKAKERESNLKGDKLEMEMAEKAGVLVLADDVGRAWRAMIVAVKTELLTLPGKIATEMKIRMGVDIDPAVVEKFIHESLIHLAESGAGDYAQLDESGDGELGASAEPVNH